MISDFGMIMIACSIGTMIIGFFTTWIYEATYKSKFATMLFIAAVIILTAGTIHKHDCKKDYIKECNVIHTLNLTYNYCLQEVSIPNASLDGESYCIYPPTRNCKTISNGCINNSLVNIDGFCIPYIPICLLFNKPTYERIDYDELKRLINWTDPLLNNETQTPNVTFYNETYFVPRYDFDTKKIIYTNLSVIKNKTN